MATFQKGDFRPYKVVRELHLGKLGENLPAGTVIMYDGNEMEWDGVKHTISNLKGAINAGWLTPEGGKAPKVAKPQPRKVAPAKAADDTDNSAPIRFRTVDHEERVVRTVASAEAPVEPVQQDGSAPVTKTAAGTSIDQYGSEGEVIGKIGSPSKTTINMGNPNEVRDVEQALRKQKKAAAPKPAPKAKAKAGKRAKKDKTIILKSGNTWDRGANWLQRVKNARALAESNPADYAEVYGLEVKSVKDRLTAPAS